LNTNAFRFAWVLVLSAIGFGASGTEHSSETPDAWADNIVKQMSVEEKVGFTHGIMAIALLDQPPIPPEALPGAGYIAGIPRLGIPALKETDASLGVAYVSGARHDGATALPSTLATAASWDPDVAYRGGAVAGREAARVGFNVLLGGGVNLTRDPRNGRNFEYYGEDPLLAGTLAGAAIRGTQDQHVISTVKHFALNDQETGRFVLSADMEESAARESDLLAFEIAIESGHPGAVMCSYNRVDAIYACENNELLNNILKRDWGYPGWVMSDWGAVHSLRSALNGLDQESGQQLDKQVFFGQPLLDAVGEKPAYRARVDDMNRRILRSLYAVGVVASQPDDGPPDLVAGATAARRIAERGIVLLRNEQDLLPLHGDVKRLVVIGGHADEGVISGGGSSQVAPPGGPALIDQLGGEGFLSFLRKAMYMPSSPLKSIRAQAPAATVVFDDGRYPAAAARLAMGADVAIVFATQFMTESFDAPDLSLPSGQDGLIQAVAAANPHTIVVLETGGPVAMPWLAAVGAVVEAWYPGIQGGEAIASVLFGKINPSGRLPLTFPASLAQLPNPQLPGQDLPERQPFTVNYPEGSDVGYRWFAKNHTQPLFPFGFGLSYTKFSYRELRVEAGRVPRVRVTVTNTGARAGTDVAQLYLAAAPHRSQQRLLGWSRVELQAGESRAVSMSIEPRMLADWDAGAHHWRLDGGSYAIAVGSDATALSLTGSLTVRASTLKP
jgi:beta-glucosidase